MSAFRGYPPSAWEFLDGLAADNTAAFFDLHRSAYRSAIAAPSAALVDALTPMLARVHPALRGEARVGRSLFRINRDTRFSVDKTPYKTHIDFLFWAGDAGSEPRSQGVCIARITSTTVVVGAGRTGLRGSALDDYRSRLVDAVLGAQLRAAVDGLVAAGSTLSDPDRARVPRPYGSDATNADLLRRDGFHLTRTEPHPDAIASDGFADWLIERFQPYAKLIDLLM